MRIEAAVHMRKFPFLTKAWRDFDVPFERLAIISILSVSFLGVLIAWGLLLHHLDKRHRELDQLGLKEAELLALAYSGHLHRTLEAIDQLALYIKHSWEVTEGRVTPSASTPINDDTTAFTMFLSVIDSKGNLASSTIPNPRKINVFNQPYFDVHRHMSDSFHIGNVRRGDFSDRPIIPFTRRLSATNEAFGGVVLISVSPEYLTARYEEKVLGRHGFLGVFNLNGIAQSVRVDGKTLDLDQAYLLQPMKFTAMAGATVLEGAGWFSDHRSRYIGWHGTNPYQMMAVSGVDRDSFRQPFYEQRSEMLRNAAISTGALAILIGLIASMLHRLAIRRAQVHQMQRTYRLATEAASEGFFIVSPVWGTGHKIVDFTITDCNERGASYLGHRKNELIGRTIHDLYDGETLNRTMRMLLRTMRDRHYDAEFDLSLLGVESPRWIHWKIIRVDDDLAINMRDISAIKAHVEKLERLTMEDSLTGLPNRHWADKYLPDAVTSAMQSGETLGLLYIDLDGFKGVNDSAGHAAGDEVLRHAAKRLREAVRPQDHVARVGGDEFIVVLKNNASCEDCSGVAQRILTAFLPGFPSPAGVHQVGTSIGISMAPLHGNSAEALMKHADAAMYLAKQSGKHRYAFFRESA